MRFKAESAVIIKPHAKTKPFSIGKDLWLGHFCILDGSEGLVIGEGCSIGSGTHIYSHSTHLLTNAYGKRKTGKVTLEDNVTVGAHSIIHYGCILRKGAILGALSQLKPHSVVGEYEYWDGNPAKFNLKMK